MEKYFDIEAPLYCNVRYNHDECSRGKDDCLIVTRFPTHWKYMCHRCGWKGEKWIDNLPPEDMVKLWKANKIDKKSPNQQTEEVRLPLDFTNDIYGQCPKGAVYLMKYGITPEEVVKYNIGYSAFYNRVIFPVYQLNDEGVKELVYWQGRTLEPESRDNPKWINIKKKGRKGIYFYAETNKDDRVVLVEDILSAIKVARHMNSIALLGSYIPDELMFNLYDFVVYIWLDMDKRNESIKYLMRMLSLGIKTNIRVTPKDPKEYGTDEIKEVLCGDSGC